MANHKSTLHVVVFPWLASGHLLPFLELSKSLAKRGHRISFISTPRNIERLPSISSKIAPLIDFVQFPLPHVDKLPPDAESTADLLQRDQIPLLLKALDDLQGPFLQCLEASSRKPDWIFLDFAKYWALPIASKFKIQCALFSVLNAFSLTFFFGDLDLAAEGEVLRTTPEELTKQPKWIPFPSNIAFRLHEAETVIRLYRDNGTGVTFARRYWSILKGCSLIAIRCCNEFESIWLDLAQSLYHKPVVPVGLLPPGGGENEEDREAESSTPQHDDKLVRILEWLNKQPPRSVVFVAFNSEAILSAEQQHELALGLKMSKVASLWALRRPAGGVAELLQEEGQELVVTGWIMQFEILGHTLVGAFFTHCGPCSVVEGLQFGHPFIMLPLIVDQGLVARRLEEEKVGVEVQRDEKDGSFTRERVAKAIRMVMEEEGKVLRSNAQKLQEVFANKDLHESYIDNLILQLNNFKK